MKTPAVNIDGRSVTLYEFFGVKESADFNELKSAYRTLCFKYHPDMNDDKNSSEEKFKVIQAVWSILGNDSRRKEYDCQLARDRGEFRRLQSELYFIIHSWSGTATTSNVSGFWQ